jgi:hypothetical protein
MNRCYSCTQMRGVKKKLIEVLPGLGYKYVAPGNLVPYMQQRLDPFTPPDCFSQKV